MKGLKFSEVANTTLAFVQLDENEDRSFSFYRLDKADIEDVVEFGNAVGALAAAKRGAILAMPVLDEAELCIKKTPRLRSSYW